MFHFDLSLARERESVFNQRYESVTLYAGPESSMHSNIVLGGRIDPVVDG